jgi:hypothetical protein
MQIITEYTPKQQQKSNTNQLLTTETLLNRGMTAKDFRSMQPFVRSSVHNDRCAEGGPVTRSADMAMPNLGPHPRYPKKIIGGALTCRHYYRNNSYRSSSSRQLRDTTNFQG